MTTVNVTESVAAPAADVWRIISDFGGLEPNDLIAGCTLEGEGVGAVRTIALQGGGEIVERLDSHDDDKLSFGYTIINDSPLPVKNYSAVVEVSGDGAGSKVSWTGNFAANGAPESDVVKLVEGIYQGGIQRVREKLGV